MQKSQTVLKELTAIIYEYSDNQYYTTCEKVAEKVIEAGYQKYPPLKPDTIIIDPEGYKTKIKNMRKNTQRILHALKLCEEALIKGNIERVDNNSACLFCDTKEYNEQGIVHTINCPITIAHDTYCGDYDFKEVTK